jgi:guanylate kinase
MDKNHKVIIITGPSGGGKTTLAKYILENYKNIKRSVSATTRLHRNGEVEGKDYYFFSKEDFERRLSNEEFLEWEQVYEDIFYGSLISEVEKLQKEGFIVLFVLDVMGAIRVKDYYGQQALSIFIKPPSPEILEARLRSRGTETDSSIYKRMSKASWEMQYEPEFDAILINDEINNSYRALKFLIEGFLMVKDE